MGLINCGVAATEEPGYRPEAYPEPQIIHHKSRKRNPTSPAMAAAGDEPETVEVTLRAVGPSRPTTLRLPPLLSVGNTLKLSPKPST